MTIDPVKIGMLTDVATIAVVRDRLLAADAETALRMLVEWADLVTPNLPELAVLVDEPGTVNWPAAIEQGRKLSTACGTIVPVKGGHLSAESSPNVLVDTTDRLGSDVKSDVEFISPAGSHQQHHGTGYSPSSAVITVMASTGDRGGAVRQGPFWYLGF